MWPTTFAAFVLTFCGMLYFVYLTYLEVSVIGAICQWCMLAALLTVGAFVAETANVRTAIEEPAARTAEA